MVRRPEQAACVRTAGVEGVTRGERAAGRPREPSRRGLFVTVAIGGGSLRYLPAAARYMTDGWGAYERHVEAEQHTVGKAHTQKIESKHINLRTRIKRLVRRTICFSKTEHMHDLVIGLFINRYEFGRLI